MARALITESTIREVAAKGGKTLEVPRGAIITTLAAEVANSRGIRIIEVDLIPAKDITGSTPSSSTQDPHTPPPGAVIAFGSDHGGFQLKTELVAFARSLGHQVLDLGTNSEQACDYPDFAYAVAKAVATGKAWRGVMIDGAGIGSCVAANKVPGVKAACCHNEFVARNAREHNDTNVLTLGSRVTGSEVCKAILKVWLTTNFAGGRHKSRVDKIDEVERRYLK